MVATALAYMMLSVTANKYFQLVGKIMHIMLKESSVAGPSTCVEPVSGFC